MVDSSHSGNIRIMGEGDKIWVELMNYDETMYAKALIAENFRDSVQKAVDSSRGYALRLTNDDGRAMWVGMGFHDRNDAFDFYATFEDFDKKRDMRRNPGKYAANTIQTKDFSLKSGELLAVNLGGNKKSKQEDFSQNPFESNQQMSWGAQKQNNFE